MRTSLTTIRRGGVLTLTPLLLAGLVACGPDDNASSGDASPSSTTSASTPADSDSGSADAGEEIDTADFTKLVSEAVDKSTTAHIAMRLESQGLSMTANGVADYTGDSPAMSLKMSAPAMGKGVIEIRMLDRVMYMAMPMVDASGKFLKIDLDDPNNPLADSVGDLTSFDPQSTLQMFSKGLKKVVRIGDETIGSDATTHYRVTSDTTALQQSLNGATPGTTLPDELTYDVWLDDQNRMRKMTTQIGDQATVEMEASDWGSPVTITAPPASQVEDMPAQ
jgi:hypothetical protein